MPTLRELSARLLSIEPSKSSDPSLDTGLAGIALAHAYLSHALGDARHRDAAQACVVRAVEIVSEVESPPSLYNGFVGVAWVVEHLIGLGIVDATDGDPNEPVDEALAEHIASAPPGGPFDLVQGLVGVGVYALERSGRAGGRALLESVVDRLAAEAVIDAEGATWRSPAWREGAPVFDLGLAHGVPGVIALLAAARAAGVRAAAIDALLPSTVGWLRAQALPAGESAFFPHARGGAGARDGFCYGDSGVARALWNAGRALDRAEWCELAVAVASKAASRSGAEVEEAGLCHGAAGLAWMFERLAARTGAHRLAEAASAWWSVVEADRLAIVGEGFLRGTAGVALAVAARDRAGDAAGAREELRDVERGGSAGWDRLLLGEGCLAGGGG